MDDSWTMEIPAYRRARGYRIYCAGGKRYLDFFQDGGHAILGHRQPGIVLEMKKTLSRGQIAAYPAKLHEQTIRAVKALIPEAVDVRLYLSAERALAAAGSHLKTVLTKADVSDPALPGRPSAGVSLWRPFLESEKAASPLLLPVLPLAAPLAPAVLVFREKPAGEVSPSDNCSPVSLAALKRSVYELTKYVENCDRSLWNRFDALTICSRKGPYLTLTIDEERFVPVFNELLENGILLSPRYPGPSIVPGEFTPGEIAYFGKRFGTE